MTPKTVTQPDALTAAQDRADRLLEALSRTRLDLLDLDCSECGAAVDEGCEGALPCEQRWLEVTDLNRRLLAKRDKGER